MNPEQVQQLIDMLAGAGEGVKAIVIIYLCLPIVTAIIGWIGGFGLVALIPRGIGRIITACGMGSLFTEDEVKTIRDDFGIGCRGSLITSEKMQVKNEILQLINKEVQRRKQKS